MSYLTPQELRDKFNINLRGWTNIVIIREAARRGLSVSKNEATGIYYISNDRAKFAWRHGYTNWNTRLSQRVAQHKDISSRILAAYGVNSTENQVFSVDEPGRAWLWAESLGSLVIKPADGIMGRNVHVGVTTREEFLDAFYDVAAFARGRVLVEKYYDGVEHRCFIVNGRFVAATLRRPASVVGDGTSTVEQLVMEKNLLREPIHNPLTLDSVARRLLSEQGLTSGSVPLAGLRVFLRRASNLHQGGDAIDATDSLPRSAIAVVESVARAIPGARSFGVDLLVPDNDGSASRVLELNTDPMVSMHHFPFEGHPRDVAGDIIDGMFPSTVGNFE